MYYKFAKFCLSFFDNLNKAKILKFFKKKKNRTIENLIDVGAHHGESIKLFSKYFKIKKILAFEPSEENFNVLNKKTRSYKNLKLYNIALGDYDGFTNFKQHYDSESSTLTEINESSNYFRKKNYLLAPFGFKRKNFIIIKIKINRLDKIISEEKIENIDILKIDTEGYDFYVIKGLGKMIQNVKILYFEHHFHNMLIKNYTLSDVHQYLIKNNFKKVIKNKMFFRKTFEYIYINKNLSHE